MTPLFRRLAFITACILYASACAILAFDSLNQSGGLAFFAALALVSAALAHVIFAIIVLLELLSPPEGKEVRALATQITALQEHVNTHDAEITDLRRAPHSATGLELESEAESFTAVQHTKDNFG
jgi:hypothetical protein